MQWTNQTEALYPLALSFALSCSVMVSGGDMCTHTKSPTPSFQSNLPVYPHFLPPLLLFFLHFSPSAFLLHLLPIHSFDTQIFLSSLPPKPSPTFFFYLLLPPHLVALIISSSSPHDVQLSCLLPHSALHSFLFRASDPSFCPHQSVSSSPSVLPSLALSLFACLPVMNHCFLQTFSLQSKPTATGTPVTAGCFDWHWKHTHTHIYKAQNRKASPFLSLLPTLTFPSHIDLCLKCMLSSLRWSIYV